MAISPSPSPPPSKVGIIVVGMHRSGTSATARLINLLGAEIAQDLMPPLEENKKGFWESFAVAEIHDRLLERLGSSWDDPMPLREGWIDTGHARQAKCDLAHEIQKQFSSSQLFVAKDPRASRLLPLWLELFDELAVTPIVVIVFRNPLEVALSLSKRNRFALAKSLLIDARCHLEVERASRRARRLFVHYEQLLADWRPFSQKLQQVIGPLLSPVTSESAAKISNFLDPDLRHNRCTHEELVSTPGVSPTVVEMYQRMREAAEAGSESSLCESFDRLDCALAEATRLFRGLVAAEEEKGRELGGQLIAEQVRSAELQRVLGAASTETARVKSELEAARCRSAELAAALAARSTEAARLAGEVTEWRNRTARSEGALAARIGELNAIKQSTSWRLTEPVRWIGRRISRPSPLR